MIDTDGNKIEWHIYPSSKPYIFLDIPGHVCLVRSQPLPKGYIWNVNKVFGYCATLKEAKIAAEHKLCMYMEND